MAHAGLDACLIVQRADLFYFSGTGQEGHLFVPVQGQAQLTIRRSFERAAWESPLKPIHEINNLSELQEIINSASPRTMRSLGMELDVLPVNNYQLYRELFSEADIRDASPLIRKVRMVKSPYEIGLIRAAGRMSDAMFGEVHRILREGMTELELAGHVELVLRKDGHQGFVRTRGFNQEAFYGHIMSGSNLAYPGCAMGPTSGAGPNASFPQGAGHKKIRRHEPVQIDYVAVVEGYMADQSRTFFLGQPPEKYLRIHEAALKIQETIVHGARPGTPAEDLYHTALSIAKAAGLEEGFMGHPRPMPFVGHGVGLELNELPVIGKNSSTPLEEGMVIAVEPKFILPGEGLAGIENTFLVTANGLERICSFDDAIQVL
jgi:Xaa-Pro aminopeptidase